MQQCQIGILTRPVGVAKPGIPRFLDGDESIGSATQCAEDAGRVVKNHRVVWRKNHSHACFTGGLIGTVQVRVSIRQQDSCRRIFRNLLQMTLENLNLAMYEVPQSVLLSKCSQRSMNRNERVVVLPSVGQRILHDVDHILVSPGCKK